MMSDDNSVLDDEFTARLLAYDEALAQGSFPAMLGGGEPANLRARLERGLACVQLLQQLRPRNIPKRNGVHPDAPTVAGPVDEALPTVVPPCPVRIGRFEIRRALGSGSFGIVYLAHDPALGREVALKIPRAGALADAECLARFQREARAAGGLDHPNLVPVYEAGQLGPVCYIAFAYCPGSTLAEWLKRRTTPVPGAQAAALVRTLAEAIHYAHQRGVLHRDLKPSNILLGGITAEDAEERRGKASLHSSLRSSASSAVSFLPKITDFGLARLSASQQAQTATGAVLGTPCYMAPEQAEGRTDDVAPTTDVYGLGAILYEVLTGRPPFWGETPVATLWQVKTVEPLPPSRLRPQLPRDLETICLKCLHKEPRRRYASAEALAEDLRRFLAGKPIQARPTGRAEQLVKWSRRRPALAAALAALVLVTGLGLGGILRQWRETQDALAEQAAARRQAEEAQRAEALAREHTEAALYHHRVVLAHREWLAGNVGRARQLLNECRPDLRHWEWHYVRRLCDDDLFTLRGHSAPAVSVAFSPDGKRLASCSGVWFSNEPGEVKLWDAATGELLWTGRGHTSPVMSVAFSPDGQRLASAAAAWRPEGGEVKLWDMAAGKTLKTLAGFPGGAFSVAFSPDGKLVASGGADSRVRLWDPETDKQVALFTEHKANVFGVAFSPDGRLLASASWDGTACVWDVAERRLLRVLSGPIDLRSVAFSPDGQRLVAASYDRSVKIWDVASGQLLRTYWGHGAAVLHAAFTPDGRWVASSDTAGNVQIWGASSGRLLRTIRGHTGSVSGVAFSPEGCRLATAATDRTVRVWDFTRDQEALPLPQTGPTRSVVFSPDGKLLAAAGYRHSSGSPSIKTVRVWSVDDWFRPKVWPGHTDWVSCVAFSPDGKLLASGSADRTVRLWDAATGRTVYRLADHGQMVTGLSFSPDGRRLASASLDRTVKLWDVATGGLLAPVLTHSQPVHDVAFSPDGRRLVSAGDNGLVLVWDAETGRELYSLRGHRGTVQRVLFSPDGKLLVAAGQDRTVHLWDMTAETEAGQDAGPRRILVGPSDTELITGLAFSPDGLRLASAGQDHTIRLWDVASGDETLTLRGHLDHVNGLAFSPDGRLLASASTQNIKIWETGDTRPAPATVREVTAWHRQQADECELAEPREWFGLAFHLARLLDMGPGDARLYVRRATAKVELGEWQRAVDDFTHSIELGSHDPWAWYLQAIARLELGDRAGYHQCCTDMLARFGEVDQPGPANMVAWACALAPGAVADLDRAIRLATSAAKADPNNASYHNTLGALQYRADRLEAARASVRESMRLSKGEFPEDWLLLAMICHRQGDRDEARRWLDKAVRWCDATSPHGGSALLRERLTPIQLLRREAEELLGGSRD